MVVAIVTLVVVYFVYYIFTVMRYDKAGNLKNSVKTFKEGKINANELEEESYKYLPSEVKYFIRRYKIDSSMLNRRGLLKLMGVILSINVSLILAVLSIFTNDILIQGVVVAVVLLPMFLISLKILGKYFKKRGWTKNEEFKRNRK